MTCTPKPAPRGGPICHGHRSHLPRFTRRLLDELIMGIDRTNRQLASAKPIALAAEFQTLKGQVGQRDRQDVYRFRLGRSGNLALSNPKPKSPTKIALLSANGKVIQQAKQQRTVQTALEAGTYYIRVESRDRRTVTPYTLKLAVLPTPSAISPATPSQFNITFDYRFDSNGWFTLERRAALESAADLWERIILNDLPDVPPGTLSGYLRNPQTGTILSNFKLDAAVDDVVIFVGARDLGGTSTSRTLALSGPSAHTNQPRYSGTSFQPWSGTMAFSTTANWFFDATPDTTTDIPSSSVDFISTAAHELAHVLGFGTSQAFDLQLVSDGRSRSGQSFGGSQAKAVNGGLPIPIAPGHIESGYQFGGSGETLLSPYVLLGKRKLPTALDIAIMADLGYTVNQAAAVSNANVASVTPTGSTPRNASSLATTRPKQTTCGCASCLSGRTSRQLKRSIS